MFELIYYYPLGEGAPSEVSRNVFAALAKKEMNSSICLFFQRSNFEPIGDNLTKFKVLSIKELLRTSQNMIVHIPQDPLVFPNRKFFLYLFSLLNKNKLVINYHGDPRTEFMIKLKSHNFGSLVYLLNYVFTPFILKSADVAIVNSQYMKSLLESKYNAKNLIVIPNGLDYSWLATTDVKKIQLKSDNPNAFILFYHGRLAPEKGIDILIKAVSLCNKKYNKNIVLYVAGEGDQRHDLEDLCVRAGMEENVIFLGKIPLNRLQSFLCSVDAAVYPSRYEPFSLAVLEAFSLVNGPVLFSKNIGLNDFVKKDGFSFHSFEPSEESLSETIKEIIENADVKIASKQKEFARRYSWDIIIDKYLEVYGTILN